MAVKKAHVLFTTDEQAIGANMDYIKSTYDGIRFVHNAVMIKGRVIGSEEGSG
jgi:hypothetical protein